MAYTIFYYYLICNVCVIRLLFYDFLLRELLLYSRLIKTYLILLSVIDFLTPRLV